MNTELFLDDDFQQHDFEESLQKQSKIPGKSDGRLDSAAPEKKYL